MDFRNATRREGPTGGRPVRVSRLGRQAGYTLVEMVFVITVVIVLMALTAVSVGGAVRSSRLAAERYYLTSLRTGVEQFKASFGFYPPLVRFVDANRAALFGEPFPDKFLEDPSEPRYSEISLPIYLLGIAGQSVDGYDGAGQARPRRDGTWDRAAPRVEPFFDPSRDAMRLRNGRLEDRWRTPIRYYRWEPTLEPKTLAGGAINPAVGEIKTHNIPHALFNAAEAGWGENRNEGAGIRSANFAIVSAGPDGVIYDGPSTDPAWMLMNKDNLVEVGR